MAKEKEELKKKETKVVKNRKTDSKKNTKQASKKEEKTKSSSVAAKNKKVATPKKITSKTLNKNEIEKTKVASKENNKSKTTVIENKIEKISSKKINSSKKENEIKKVSPNIVKEKEESIIEKIKSFIAKIVAMQEEAKKEDLLKNTKKVKNKKTESELVSSLLENPVYLTEYYDLPYRYNETVVKILAQTPKRIFVYWDIADEDRIRYEKAFGKDFFDKTYPVLLVHNDDKNYTTEIPINDFANSWYIDIKDPKTKYSIQLGRKFREIPTNIDLQKNQEESIILKNDYLPIAQSNLLEVPNDHILFEKIPSRIIYRNVKTYEEKEKVVSQIKTPFGILHDIKEFYENNYKNEIDGVTFDLNNPTSGGLSSSSFK